MCTALGLRNMLTHRRTGLSGSCEGPIDMANETEGRKIKYWWRKESKGKQKEWKDVRARSFIYWQKMHDGLYT